MKARKRTPNPEAWLLRKPVAVPPAFIVKTDMTLVFIPRPRCPACSSVSLKTLRAVKDQGDGTGSRRSLCLQCGHRFRIIFD